MRKRNPTVTEVQDPNYAVLAISNSPKRGYLMVESIFLNKWSGPVTCSCSTPVLRKRPTNLPSKNPWLNRVRKSSERETASSMIDWTVQKRTWGKIVTTVENEYMPTKKRVRSTIRAQTLILYEDFVPQIISKTCCLHGGDCFSPLEQGGDDLLSPNVRVSYNELGRLIIQCKRWPKAYVMKRLRVNLYCQAMVINENGESRTYWYTIPLLRRYSQRHGWDYFTTRYTYDTIYWHIYETLCDRTYEQTCSGRLGVAQLVTFIRMTRLPPSAGALQHADVALVRWMGVSSLSRNHQRDSLYRPVCEYPLSANHCLYMNGQV